LLRGSVCKTFVYQFSVIAKRKPPQQKSKVKRQGGSGGGRQPFRHRVEPKRAPGLAAVKYKQQVAARGALSDRYEEKASSALACVQAAARAEWPEAMKREMQACRTPEQQRVWSEKWAEHLAGRVASDGTPLRPAGGGSGAGGGRQPS
jgi:hypothetical protein